jgi:hypothetical protein
LWRRSGVGNRGRPRPRAKVGGLVSAKIWPNIAKLRACGRFAQVYPVVLAGDVWRRRRSRLPVRKVRVLAVRNGVATLMTVGGKQTSGFPVAQFHRRFSLSSRPGVTEPKDDLRESAGENFTFEIVSPKHGRFTVTAPSRFREEIEARIWSVIRSRTRSRGREFIVASNTPRPGSMSRWKSPGTSRDFVYLHRLIWKLAGRAPAELLDHVDRNPLNNSESNLRPATKSQNCQNRGRQSSNTSGFIGVSWHRGKQRWTAQIQAEGRLIHLGTFDDIADAREARDEAARRYHGDFAVLNSNREVTGPETDCSGAEQGVTP